MLMLVILLSIYNCYINNASVVKKSTRKECDIFAIIYRNRKRSINSKNQGDLRILYELFIS